MISAIALKQSAPFLAATAAGSFIPKAAVAVMDGLTVAIVLYVFLRYLLFLAVPAREQQLAPATATTR